jgi:hypothetical protein
MYIYVSSGAIHGYLDTLAIGHAALKHGSPLNTGTYLPRGQTALINNRSLKTDTIYAFYTWHIALIHGSPLDTDIYLPHLAYRYNQIHSPLTDTPIHVSSTLWSSGLQISVVCLRINSLFLYTNTESPQRSVLTCYLIYQVLR